MKLRLWRCILLTYVVAILFGTFFPFTFVSTPEALAAKVRRIKWIPFRDPKTGGLHSPRDTAQNIAVFVPFGILAALALRRSHSRGYALVPAVASGFSTSLLIEILQLFTRTRVTNVTDVIANTTGCSIGALAVVLWHRRYGEKESLRTT